jgi:hypothetical protein
LSVADDLLEAWIGVDLKPLAGGLVDPQQIIQDVLNQGAGMQAAELVTILVNSRLSQRGRGE